SLAGRDAVFALAVREAFQKSGEPSFDLTAPWDSTPAGADREWTPAGASGGPQLMQSWTPLPGANSVGVRSEGSAVAVPEGAWVGEDWPASGVGGDSFFALLAADTAGE